MEKDSYIKVNIPNENSGQEEEKYVSISLLFGRFWDEYIRDMIPDEIMRGMLMELGLGDTEVVKMMGLLKVGKVEFERGDYREVAYL
jgi:hypothetical protein